jgi:hypothetical protein
MKRSIFVGRLGPGERLSILPEYSGKTVRIYRWVPDYAADCIRQGDYTLLDPEEGRHYGGRKPKRLSAVVPADELEYRQGDEFKWYPSQDRDLSVESCAGKRRHAPLGGVKRPSCKHGVVKSGPRKGLCRRKPRQVLSAAAKRELRAINRMLRKR